MNGRLWGFAPWTKSGLQAIHAYLPHDMGNRGLILIWSIFRDKDLRRLVIIVGIRIKKSAKNTMFLVCSRLFLM